MTKEFHKNLDFLKQELVEMSKLAFIMLGDSITALSTSNTELAESVDLKKEKLREYDVEIETKSLQLITLYQPMAIDLRTIAAILKIITYLYRVGRYGKDIAAVVSLLNNKQPLSEIIGIKHMWEHVQSMLDDAVDSFVTDDISKLKGFSERDTEIDQLRWSIFRESVSYMMEDPRNITISAHLIMIARYLERCGDHACKIAEKVYYMVTGKHIEIT
jgi:phosphate transport system protein